MASKNQKKIIELKNSVQIVKNTKLVQLNQNKISSKDQSVVLDKNNFLLENQSGELNRGDLSLKKDIIVTVVETKILGLLFLLIEGTALGPFCMIAKKVQHFEGLGPKGLLLTTKVMYKCSLMDELSLSSQLLSDHVIQVDKLLRNLIIDQIDQSIACNNILKERLFPYYQAGDLSKIRDLYLVGGSEEKVIASCPYKLSNWLITQSELSYTSSVTSGVSSYPHLKFVHSTYGTHYRSTSVSKNGEILISHGLLVTTVSPNAHIRVTVGEMNEIISKVTLLFVLENTNYKVGKKGMK